MLKLLSYILKNGVVTMPDLYAPLGADADGMPSLTDNPCVGEGCNACAKACPTDAIEIQDESGGAMVKLDLGACISCQLCIDLCPSGTIVKDRSTALAKRRRDDLVLNNQAEKVDFGIEKKSEQVTKDLFRKSLHARVVSTGCSACDLEVGACVNPIFDLERYGVHIVASPRFADALLVTGPVGKGMRDSLLRCYAAMPEPKLVVAVGTCAISGGVHKDGYTEANGIDKILPVAVYIPGCPPHPWSIIHGILLAMNKLEK